jgi:hypothetical protein
MFGNYHRNDKRLFYQNNKRKTTPEVGKPDDFTGAVVILILKESSKTNLKTW